MSHREFNATRTMLANAMATAGAELLEYMGVGAALAAIPNTEPPKYVVAGTLQMIAKMLPGLESTSPATAKVGIEGLTRYEPPSWWQDQCDREDCVEAVDGAYFKVADVERLLGAHAGVVAAESSSDYVLMPKRLTAENGAKGALSGEFKETINFTCHECGGSGDDANSDVDAECPECKGDGIVTQTVPVSWDTIKDIYKRAVDLLAAPAAQAPVQNAEEVRRAALEEAITVCKRNKDWRSVDGIRALQSAQGEKGGEA